MLVPRRDSDAHLAGKKIEKKHKKKKDKSKKKVSKMAPPPGQKVVYVKKMPNTHRATSSTAPPPKVVSVKKMPFRGKWIPKIPRGSVAVSLQNLKKKAAVRAKTDIPIKAKTRPKTPPKSPSPSPPKSPACSNCGAPMSEAEALKASAERDMEDLEADYTRSPSMDTAEPVVVSPTRSRADSPDAVSEAPSSYIRPRFH